MRRLIVLIRADARRRRTDVKRAGVRHRYVAVPSSYKHHARATIEHLFRRALPRRRRTAPLSSLSRLQSESERIHELLRRRTDGRRLGKARSRGTHYVHISLVSATELLDYYCGGGGGQESNQSS